MDTKNFITQATGLVHYYAVSHLDKTDEFPTFSTYVVWSCSGDYPKAMLSTTLPDGMYYEVTYDAKNNKMYLYAYKKLENKVVMDGCLVDSMALFIQKSKDEVRKYLFDHQELTSRFEVYTTWACKVLQNWKALFKTSDTQDNLYFEITFNGDKSEAYLDVYKHFDTFSISPDHFED